MKFFQTILLVSILLGSRANEEPNSHGIQEIVPYIGNGTVSLQMQFMVSIRRSTLETVAEHFGNGHICGGVILSRNHILTVASCFEISNIQIPVDEIFIIAGSRYRYIQDGSVQRDSRRITIHPDYALDPSNNLAIIEVMNDAEF